MLPSEKSQQKIRNLRKLYFKIKGKKDELLAKYNDNSFVDDPSVDIETIAKENGITEIVCVPPKEINYERAIFNGTVIKLNKKDSPVEKRFSIAHDLKHYLYEKEEYYKTREIIFKKPYLIYKRKEIEQKAGYIARFAKTSKSERKPILKANILLKLHLRDYFKLLSKKVAEIVSVNIGRDVPIETAKRAIKKLSSNYFSNNNDLIYISSKDFITDVINKLYDEETADYFAANLLVPTSRFILWEDKPDNVIAKAFNVPIKCIKKRREEIQSEIVFMTINRKSFERIFSAEV